VDSEDVSFDTIAKSALEQCVQTRDELGELHGRDNLVSMRHSGTPSQLYYRLVEGSIIIQGRPYSLLSPSDEADLLETLEARSRNGLSVAEAIILRKLKLQRVRVASFGLSGCALSQFQHMRAHNLSLPVLRPRIPSALTGLPPARKPPEPDPEVLKTLYDVQTTPYKSSFLGRLNGFSVRRAPVVAVDWEARSPWMDLMEDIRAHYALKLYAPSVLESQLLT
jgi:hypothetical protein